MPPTEAGGSRRGSTRVTPLWLLAIAALLLAARVGTGVWAEVRPEGRPDLVDWVTPSEAQGDANFNGRSMLYVFTDSRVPASRKLVSDVFTKPDAARRINDAFASVRIDGPASGDTPEAAELRRRFEVTELPTLVVVSQDGTKSRRIVGHTSANATLQALLSARLEMMGLPAGSAGRGVQFKFGGRFGDHAVGNAPPDSTLPDAAAR